ncbi:hypothetical protein SFK227_0401 [Shigella flexneri K-227]|uniref:Uncharacterized protein n=1 Tax=Shigella flexneri K-227 TaxID=766147 RepID=F5NQM4_SHIFL|nr:hypothetical protein SD1617_2955 [Shigella dysenteriae 1617]EFZ60672.1 hypothetical protein ECLT68_0155 [Escherichia coli LT-68]EGI96263.1 hypothetical protein SD15574_2550 [Shigella dysenteriae 155-74]EGK40312.1 hypothetical protein SFK227_0401 [Shigella flexneri K-227]EIQ52479.1 hypothetical protein SS482266_2173 [Shigella sonnei 4822-66]CSP96687.1 Uncharacterised protein [Shigella sonnei]
MPQTKPVYLNFEQGIHRLFDFILDLTGTTKTQGVFIRQKYGNASGIP